MRLLGHVNIAGAGVDGADDFRVQALVGDRFLALGGGYQLREYGGGFQFQVADIGGSGQPLCPEVAGCIGDGGIPQPGAGGVVVIAGSAWGMTVEVVPQGIR